MKRQLLIMGSLLASLLFLAGCQQEQIQSFSGRTMGTQYNISIVANEIQAGLVSRQISAELGRFNDIFSTYVRDSEINRISEAPVGEWIDLSGHMYSLLKVAQDIAAKTDGAFDPTVRPLVDIWGFGPLQRPDAVPGELELSEALENVDWQGFKLADGKLHKSVPVAFDLSAIAKGYGVDVIAGILAEQGFERYLVEVGGEMRLSGLKPQEQRWRIAIETPEALAREAYKVLEITDISIATSGDYRNFFVENGKRYSHTIDPRSGWPIEHDLASVTVLTESSAEADAWATALDVAGPDQALEWAKEQDLSVFLIIRQNGEFIDRMSTKFTEFVN